MSYNIIVTDNFEREAKNLKKKYHALKSELKDFIETLEQNPTQGTLITENVYKFRLAVKSKGKGKSGGLRIIIYIHIIENEDGTKSVYLLSIYDKSDHENIPEHFVKKMVHEIQTELEEGTPAANETFEEGENDEDSTE